MDTGRRRHPRSLPAQPTQPSQSESKQSLWHIEARTSGSAAVDTASMLAPATRLLLCNNGNTFAAVQ